MIAATNALLRPLFIAGITLFAAPSLVAGTMDLKPSLAKDGNSSNLASEVNWLTGEGASLGGILFPSVHFQGVYGATTADDVEHFGAGHHDPAGDGWTIQGFEFGTSLKATDWFEGFATYHLFQDAASNDWDGEFEEWFGKIKNLPGGFEVRGGRYLTRFGFHNSIHSHGWDYVDDYLVAGRFLGDDGQSAIGGEVSWTLPVSWTSILSVSVGVAPEHEHEEEEEGHGGPRFESEGAHFTDTFVVANWTNQRDYNDFHQFRFGASGAWGDNEFGKTTQLYGAHFEYQWRRNGYESGGQYFRWRTEAMLRQFDAVRGGHDHEDEAGQHEDSPLEAGLNEFGAYTAVAYGFDNGLELGLRGDFVEGIADAGLDRRFRVSPAVTYYFNKQRTVYLRAQYNYDHSNDFDEEHSVWTQVGFNWGGAEVR